MDNTHHSMKSIIIQLAVICGLSVAGFLGYWGYTYFGPITAPIKQYGHADQAVEKVWPIRVTDARYGNHSVSRIVYGEIVTKRHHSLAFRTNGCIDLVANGLDVGMAVAEGQLLAQLDDSLERLNIKSVEARQAEITAKRNELHTRIRSLNRLIEKKTLILNITKNTLNRQKELRENRISSAESVEMAERQALEAETSMLSLRNELELLKASLLVFNAQDDHLLQDLKKARVALKNTRIYAPKNGIVTELNLVAGNCVTAMAPVIKLVEPNDVEAILEISTSLFKRLIQSGPITNRAVEIFNGGEPILGKVKGINPQLLEDQQLVRVSVSMDSRSGAQPLLIGQKIRARIVEKALNGVLELPYVALYGEGSAYIVVDGRLKRVKLDIVYRNNTTIYAKSDIEPGAQIVVTRLKQAVDGMRVSVLDQTSE